MKYLAFDTRHRPSWTTSATPTHPVSLVSPVRLIYLDENLQSRRGIYRLRST